MTMKDILGFLFASALLVGYMLIPIEANTPNAVEIPIERQVEKVVISHDLLATYYNAVESQCDSDPLVTADMSKINKEKLSNLDIRWCAVSRDMLEHYPYGTVIHVQSDNETLNGYWEVHDTMNKRYTGRIDFLFPEGENFDFDRPMTVKVTKVIN